MKTGLVRWEWHSLDHVGASESEVEAPTGRDALGLLPPQLDRPRAGRRPADLGAQHLGRLSARRRHRQDPLAPRRQQELLQDGPGHEDGLAARRPHAAGRRAHVLRRRLEPADPPPVARPCGSRSTSRRTKRAWLAAYTHRDPPLLAASQGNMQTLADGNTVVGYGGVPAISEFARDGSLLFDAHQPFDMSFYRAFRFPWSAPPAEPARGARRASTTPAKRRSCTRAGTAPPTWPPGACSPGKRPDR